MYIQYKLNEYKYIHINIFKIYTVCVCIYIYVINIHSTRTYIMLTKYFILDAINRLTALATITKNQDKNNICIAYFKP